MLRSLVRPNDIWPPLEFDLHCPALGKGGRVLWSHKPDRCFAPFPIGILMKISQQVSDLAALSGSIQIKIANQSGREKCRSRLEVKGKNRQSKESGTVPVQLRATQLSGCGFSRLPGRN